mmetsp:Transcript_10969/g.16600  ORF Transcript_10969/g.16600 Transcript_10969/m.16600 type:complete len:283 (-) Transcript_10969:210-1058(-)
MIRREPSVGLIYALLVLSLVLGSSFSTSSVGIDDGCNNKPPNSGTSDDNVRADECASSGRGRTDPGRQDQKEDEEDEEWCNECDWEEVIEALGCTGIVHRSVPTDEEFMVMRRAYESAVGAEDSTISPVVGGHSFLVPHRAGPAEGGKGRGIFAAAPIARGEAVWTWRHMAVFYDVYQFREFLGSIPKDNACDVLYWAYPHKDDDDGATPRVSVELDHTALCNDADTEGEKNVGRDPEVEAKLGNDEYEGAFAMRDIEEGEELLCRYADFDSGEDGWEAFGL